MHRGQHLDVAHRVEAEPARDPAGDQVDDQLGGLLAGVQAGVLGGSQRTGRSRRARQLRGLAGVDPVGVDHHPGLRGLPEDLGQPDPGDRLSAASRSRSTSPAPTEGSWSTSPTSSRCAPGGIALTSLLARIRSSMEASSTTTRSASSGLSRSKRGVPAGPQLQQPVHGGGRVPGQLGQPFRGPPGRRGQHDLRALRRGQLDDRPDGEALAAARARRSAPPPCAVSASRTACSCSGASSCPVRVRSQASALSQSTSRNAGIRSAGCVEQAQQPGGQRLLGPVERHQVHRRRSAPPRRPAGRADRLRGPPPRAATSSARQGRTRSAVDVEDLGGVGDQVRLRAGSSARRRRPRTGCTAGRP